VGEVALSPDGQRIAYTAVYRERPGPPHTRAFLLDVRSGREQRLDDDARPIGALSWSPDGTALAFRGQADEGYGLVVARPDGTQRRLLAPLGWTNHPLPWTGDSHSWSPDGKRIAFVSAVESRSGPPTTDPVEITRYLYKPHTAGGNPPFNDGRRLQLFVVDVKGGAAARRLTDSAYHDHSPVWSPRGDEVAFLSNRAADPDRVFNYDVFAVAVEGGAVRRLTDTPSAEYAPSWSPDGRQLGYLATKRPRTSSETTMEDTHVWRIGADGTNAVELGSVVDNRQGPPRWSKDGRWLYFTVEEAGDVRLYRLPAEGGAAEPVAPARGARGWVGDWSLADDGTLAFALATPEGPAELMVQDPGGPRALTRLNAELAARPRATVESFRVAAEGGLEIEAFLTLPLGRTDGSRHPLIVAIHGGPHAQQGPTWSARGQIYAARGWATLMVNYRGSTGYGQKLTDAIFGDQNGAEARDVLAGVDEALKRYPWLDAERLGVEGSSYGGQLANWLVTQTERFKAAVPLAGISNLVSFNYMAYYHDYLAVEFGTYPHEAGLMDKLWQRSPLRLVARVKTPVLFLHGENDNDVPIAEAEQFFIALKDVGVETVLVRYPREGHGLSETVHQADAFDRSIAWYERWFGKR
jgi:dipeptidyl aminopeptidase/acylaminoacyl peptidase